MIVVPASDELNTAISNVEDAGVTVSQTTSETLANQEEPQVPTDVQTLEVSEEVLIVSQSVLPETGDNVVLSLATVLSGILMTMVGFLGIRKRKED